MAPPNDLFQEFMRTLMERAQTSIVLAVSVSKEARDNTNRPLKLRNPNPYYGNLHLKCYYFCQQCEDLFEVARSLGYEHVLFAPGFLKHRILNRWQQHKICMQRNRVAPIIWDEFKILLRKNLGESNTVVGYTWSKLRGNVQYQTKKVQDWAAHLEHL